MEPAYPPRTAPVKAKIKKVFDEQKSGKLHSGSKKGPVVKSRAQTIAIALSEGREKAKEHGKREDSGATSPMEVYNPTLPGPAGPKGVQGLLEGSGGPSTEETRRPYGDQTQKDHWDRGQPHSYKPPLSGAHGWGHNATQRQGSLRTSGKGHQIGKR